MNGKIKRRMIVVGGIIVIVVILALAVAGGSTSAKVMSVSDAAAGVSTSQKIQVTGTVVDNSYAIDSDGVLTFDIRDEGSTTGPTVHVSYDKGVSATFGNGVSAICTGRMNDQDTLVATELVTKCPSKYENATDALSVSQLLGYGQSMVGKTAKIQGSVTDAGFADATKSVRFTLTDSQGSQVPVHFEGALPSGTEQKGVTLVVQGALDSAGVFQATDVAQGA